MQAPQHVLIAGASGFLGTQLTRHLKRSGHRVTRLVRRPAQADEITWDPYAGPLDPSVLDGVDTVVNLAGSPLVGNPHSRRWAEDVMTSRVRTTSTLTTALAALGQSGQQVPALVAGNGISWYGDHGDTPLPETASSRGDALLTRVTREWEAATEPAAAAGARVCVLRTAVVLDGDSSPFRLMRPVYRAGLGARLGSGNQYFPIVSLRDWVAAATFLITHPRASGPFNMVCPEVPTHAAYGAALAAPRRVLLRVPGAVIERAAGAMAPELLGSVRAVPQALEDAGFTFRDRDVKAVISAATHRLRD